MLDRFLDTPSSESREARRPRVRRPRRHVPRLYDALESREVLSPFPFTGTFSGPYTVLVEGPGGKQTDSGTVSITISVSSIHDMGDGVYQADIVGTMSVTGFLGQSATYPFSGQNGLETGNASTGPEPSVDINVQAYYANAPLNFISIEGYCTNGAIVASCNIGMNGSDTPNAASVTLSGSPASPNPTPTPAPVALTGASLVREKKGASQIVVNFSGPLGGGAGLPLADFRLTTVAAKKKPAKVIPLAGASFDATADRITLTPRGKSKLKSSLELTVSGLPGGSETLTIRK